MEHMWSNDEVVFMIFNALIEFFNPWSRIVFLSFFPEGGIQSSRRGDSSDCPVWLIGINYLDRERGKYLGAQTMMLRLLPYFRLFP